MPLINRQTSSLMFGYFKSHIQINMSTVLFNRFVQVAFALWLYNCLAATQAHCQAKLPALFTDSMILQRDKPISIWGTARPGEKVQVSMAGKTQKTNTGKDGKWQVTMPALPAGGPHTLQVKASNTLLIHQILMGDVWFCSGQSNMVHQINIHDVTYGPEIATANYPAIRQYWIPTLTALSGPVDTLPKGQWIPAVGEQLRPFSAVAYFFAKKLYEQYKVPIGIINASVGGTPIEAWTSAEGLQAFEDIKKTILRNKDTALLNSLTRNSSNRPAAPPPPPDKGLNKTMPWYMPAYLPQGWRPINIPGYWEDQGIKNLDGVVWYRKEIDVPASMCNKPATVWLGRIVDADELYINGTRVGNTTYMYPQRRYKVASNMLQPGKNIMVVRVTNNAGKGGFVPDKPYCLFAGADTIDLKGTWQYKVGQVFERMPGMAGGGGAIYSQNQPTALLKTMVAPVINYAIKGVLWYQGESNTGNARQYEHLQKAQIADWRNKWKQPDLPFLYVQLPGFMDYNYLPEESNWALFRQSQLNALSVPNTAMAVAIDLGEWNDIHPDNKKDVGERLALAALHNVYKENVVYSGPIISKATIEGNAIRISFNHVGSGLTTTDGQAPDNFAIAGADKKFVWAEAHIENNTIIVQSPRVPAPMYVRYAYADNPTNPNLINREGLPASPFSTLE